MRLTLLALLLGGFAAPAVMAADTHNHAHVAEAQGLRVVHAWTRATNGTEAFVFAEIENTGAAERVLTAASTKAAHEGRVVGFGFKDGAAHWTVLSGIPVAPGGELELEPDTLAIRLEGLHVPLTEGGNLDLVFIFDTLMIEATAEILAGNARSHSHAGHSH
jgi:copper(I)-binding protein